MFSWLNAPIANKNIIIFAFPKGRMLSIAERAKRVSEIAFPKDIYNFSPI